jgi:hypothetical protein
MRRFVARTTKIDVVAQISREALELDWLVLSRFDGSATVAQRPGRRASLNFTVPAPRQRTSTTILDLTRNEQQGGWAPVFRKAAFSLPSSLPTITHPVGTGDGEVRGRAEDEGVPRSCAGAD